MFKFLEISLLLIIFLNPEAYSQENAKIFSVADVVVATDTLSEVTFRDALEARIGAKIESFDQSASNKMVVPTYAHSFMAALHHCFADHRPMVISPDMIWLMICQGLAQHIELHADSLRSKFVNFEGKKEIMARNDYLIKGRADNNWELEFPKFADSIRQYVGDDLFNLMTPKFSTTTQAETVAYQVTLMHSVDRYFNYRELSECGIPEIIIEGTTKDWKWILKNVEKLETYGLSSWSVRIKPILKEFINASKNKINKEFWNSIYKWSGECGGPFINGWICEFFPYIIDENGQYQKNLITEFNMLPEMLPSGISKVEINWLHRDNVNEKLLESKMEAYAGFLGIEQNESTKALRPLIQWTIIDKKDSQKADRRNLIAGKSVLITKDISELGNEIYFNVDIMPTFPGGELGIKKYISTNTKYPKEAQEKKISGKVYVRFCITKTGSITRAVIVRGLNPLLDKEAIRVVESLPKWEPAILNGKKVNVWYIIPLSFGQE